MQLRRIRTVLIVASAITCSALAEPTVVDQPTPALLSNSDVSQRQLATNTESSALGLPDAEGTSTSRERSAIGEATGTGNIGFSRTLGALVGVVGLLFLLSFLLKWVSRRKGGLMSSLGAAGRAPSGVIEVLARYPVARTQRLVLLRIGRRVVLCNQSVGVRASAGSMTTLTEFTDAEEVASILRSVRDTDGTSHSTLFREALKGAEADPETSAASPERSLRYESPEGDSVSWQDERVQMPTRPAASSAVDPSIGRLRARLAAMRVEGDAA